MAITSGCFYADVATHDVVTEEVYDRWVAGQSYPMGE